MTRLCGRFECSKQIDLIDNNVPKRFGSNVKIQANMFENLQGNKRLRQGDPILTVVFNCSLEWIVVDILNRTTQILVNGGDIVIVYKSVKDIKKV